MANERRIDSRREHAVPQKYLGRSPRRPEAVSRWRKRHGLDLYSGWPPSAEQVQRATQELSDLEQRARGTQNPRYAWAAYQVALHAGLTPPAWVLYYFSVVARNIAWLTYPENRPGKGKKAGIAEALQRALGFLGGIQGAEDFTLPAESKRPLSKRTGRGTNPFMDKEDLAGEHHRVALLVWSHAATGLTDDAACKKVKAESDLGITHIRSVWKANKHLFDLEGTWYTPPAPKRPPRRKASVKSPTL